MALPIRPLPVPDDHPGDDPTGRIDTVDGEGAGPGGPGSERRALARALAERIRPLVPAGERRLEVSGPLGALVDGGLVRGSTVVVEGIGATSLALGMVASVSAGSWCVVVGLGELAPVAVVETGIDPARVAFVDVEGSGRVAEVIGALVGAVDLVLVDARLAVRSVEVRRLAARSRERGSVVVVVRPDGADAGAAWSADVVLTVREGSWTGPGRGGGHLRERTVVIDVVGRGRSSRTSRHDLLLPG